METDRVQDALQREKLESQRLQEEGKMRVAQLESDMQLLHKKCQSESEINSTETDALKTENRNLHIKLRELENHLQEEKDAMQIECKLLQKSLHDKARLQHDHDALTIECDDLRAELQVSARLHHTKAQYATVR